MFFLENESVKRLLTGETASSFVHVSVVTLYM